MSWRAQDANFAELLMDRNCGIASVSSKYAVWECLDGSAHGCSLDTAEYDSIVR